MIDRFAMIVVCDYHEFDVCVAIRVASSSLLFLSSIIIYPIHDSFANSNETYCCDAVAVELQAELESVEIEIVALVVAFLPQYFQ